MVTFLPLARWLPNSTAILFASAVEQSTGPHHFGSSHKNTIFLLSSIVTARKHRREHYGHGTPGDDTMSSPLPPPKKKSKPRGAVTARQRTSGDSRTAVHFPLGHAPSAASASGRCATAQARIRRCASPVRECGGRRGKSRDELSPATAEEEK